MWLKMGKNGGKCMKNPLVVGGAGELDHILTITIPQLYLNYTYYLSIISSYYVYVFV